MAGFGPNLSTSQKMYLCGTNCTYEGGVVADSGPLPMRPPNIYLCIAHCTNREGVVAGSGPNLSNPHNIHYLAPTVPMWEEWWHVLALVQCVYPTNTCVAPTVTLGKEWWQVLALDRYN